MVYIYYIIYQRIFGQNLRSEIYTNIWYIFSVGIPEYIPYAGIYSGCDTIYIRRRRRFFKNLHKYYMKIQSKNSQQIHYTRSFLQKFRAPAAQLTATIKQLSRREPQTSQSSKKHWFFSSQCLSLSLRVVAEQKDSFTTLTQQFSNI